MNAEAARPLGELVLDRLRAQAAQYGVELVGLNWDVARFNKQRDPATSLDALLAHWVCNGRNVKMTLRPDGSPSTRMVGSRVANSRSSAMTLARVSRLNSVDLPALV